MTWAAHRACMAWVASPSVQESCGSGTGGPCKLTPLSPLFAGEAQPRKLHTIPIPTARCYTYSWDQDNFGKWKGSPIPPSETTALCSPSQRVLSLAGAATSNWVHDTSCGWSLKEPITNWCWRER